MKKTVFGFVVLALIGILSISPSNNVNAQILVKVKPNREKVVIAKPRPPMANMVWIGEGWTWNSPQNRYVPQAGRWVKSRRGQVWKAGYWQRAKGGHIWVPGRWTKLVRRGRR